ncbi:MAG TPA: STAS/SEC14 domain-containing protein [Verrucomicrobiae bacterium]|nr:STAS/SEC14 domain-containing protein [Verrucomicrobiae bacterium]
MAITLEEKNGGKVLEVSLTGKLTREDYETFVPAVDRLIKDHGKIRMLVAMHDFHGWTASALWEDTKFAAHHFRDIERLALVGETKWQQGMAVFCKPFTTAEIRYFNHTEAETARRWIAEQLFEAAGKTSAPAM